MIVGVGCDIVNINRINAMIDKYGEKFLQRIYTKQEIANAPLHDSKRISYYAKRFAAKEAYAKAIGTGIGASISFREIEILSDKKGKPCFNILRAGVEANAHLSLTDDFPFAIAYVVIDS